MQVFNELVYIGVWLAVVAIFAVTEFFVALVATYTGIFLRTAYQEIIPTRFFVLVRRYGFWGILSGLARSLNVRSIANPGFSLRWMRYLRVIWPGALWGFFVIFVSAGFGLFVPLTVFVLLSQISKSALLGEVLIRTGLVGAILALALGAGFWLQGLSYLARPQVRRVGTLPRLSVRGLSSNVRNNLALNIFWYSRLKWVGIFAGAYPWIFLLVLTFSEGASSSGAGKSSSAKISTLEGIVILIMLIAVTVVPPLMTVRFIGRRIVSWKVSGELYLLLNPREDAGKRNRRYPPIFPMMDPLGHKRYQLARIAQDLSSAAKVVDAGKVIDRGHHPISTILQAVSARIWQFLTSSQSLQETLPDDFVNVLDMTLVMLCQSESPEAYRQVAERVAAFDENGSPLATPEKGNLRIVALAGSVTAVLRGASALIVGLATSVAILIICVLYIRHRIDLNSVLKYLP